MRIYNMYALEHESSTGLALKVPAGHLRNWFGVHTFAVVNEQADDTEKKRRESRSMRLLQWRCLWEDYHPTLRNLGVSGLDGWTHRKNHR